MEGLSLSTLKPPELKTPKFEDVVTYSISYEFFCRKVEVLTSCHTIARLVAIHWVYIVYLFLAAFQLS